jgi:uncharacterized protein DUF11
VITDVLPSTAWFASVSPSTSCTTPAVGHTGTVICTLSAPLAAGGDATLSLAVTIVTPKKTTIPNTASVSTTVADPFSATTPPRR